MRPDLPRLQRVLGGEPLRRLRQRLRARYERGVVGDPFTLGALSAAERAALENLLGTPLRRASSMRISQSRLDAVLRGAGLAPDLRSALEALDGPIIERARLRRERTQAWDAVFSHIEHPALAACLKPPAAFGQLKRLARNDPVTARDLLHQTAAVIARLPVQGLPLAGLAAETLGDAHALDAGRSIARLVLNAMAPATAGVAEDESDRSRWARLGVLVGELNRPALVLNLPAAADTPVGALAETARRCGEPLHLSLRALLRQPPRWDLADREVFICENPGIVALAAERLGRRSAPLVCTDGNPAAAQLALLRQLCEAGARLRYHGDFDWEGLRIGNRVMREFGARPWRFSTSDYRPGSLRALEGAPCPASWDDGLSVAMQEGGTALHEEAAADALLADLAAAPPSRLNG